MSRTPYATPIEGKYRVHLRRFDPAATSGVDKDAGLAELETWGEEFARLGNLLTYAGQHALLVVLQGKDASGKDGAIRKILDFSNIQNAHVEPFKVPTELERSHDFLWRVHQVVPRRGHIALFNRSHYEDVIAARLHHLVPKATWKARFAHINAFERLLLDSNVILVKFYLHVSPEEQKERLLAREKDPRTAWKLNPEDWRELTLQREVTAAYEDVLEKCSSPEAPWYLVPADKKWFRNLAVMQRLVLALRPYRQSWLATLKEMGRDALKEIQTLRGKIDKKIDKEIEKEGAREGEKP